MTRTSLLTAGWLAMISAFVSIPLVYLSFRFEGRLDATAVVSQTAIQVTGTLLFVAILLYLKKLLNEVFRFHVTDRSIGLLIKAGVIAGVLTLVALHVAAVKETAAAAVIVIVVVQGVVQLQFGYRLLRLPDELGGMLKPFCYTTMATGVLIASVVLIPVGVVVSALADLMLGTIFFNLSRQAEVADPEQTGL